MLVQAIPSGPLRDAGAIESVLVSAIAGAQRRLVLTSPYFVPEPSLMTALAEAAGRGVDVTLIVPASGDSRLANVACRAAQGELVAAGVNVRLYEGGVLHTKSVTIDGEISLFGSLNLDPRSLHLNFEVTLAVYDEDFTAELEALQMSYADNSRPVQLEEWQARGWSAPLIESSIRFLHPLL
jgi:cardiolipin synthase